MFTQWNTSQDLTLSKAEWRAVVNVANPHALVVVLYALIFCVWVAQYLPSHDNLCSDVKVADVFVALGVERGVLFESLLHLFRVNHDCRVVCASDCVCVWGYLNASSVDVCNPHGRIVCSGLPRFCHWWSSITVRDSINCHLFNRQWNMDSWNVLRRQEWRGWG